MALEWIGKYQLIRPLGGGGFGEVFLALDPDIGRELAIKLFKPKDENLIAFATSSSEEGMQKLQERFLAEAKILASLEHEPHIINIIEFGRLDDGSPWYAMPYLPHSLRDILGQDVFDKRALEELPAEQQPVSLPLNQALPLLEQILSAMAAAHNKGLVHRDIKPANILLTDNHQVRICDFGIAKAPDGQHSTVSHLGMGSRNYMAPEQRESAKHVDARADVYALGVLAYRIFTGRLPQGRFADPVLHQPALGTALNKWVLTALSEDADQRYTNATDMLQQFNQARQSADAASEATATFVGQSSAELKAELQPLKAKITELLKQEGLLSDKSQQQLQVLADIADISESELKALIQQTEQELAGEIGAFKKWRQGVEKQLAANNGQLKAELKTTLLQAGLALGKTEAQLLPFLGGKAAKAERKPTKPEHEHKAFPLKPVAALVIVALLGFGGWQFNSYSNEQAALKQQDEQAWQQAKTSHTEQSYRQYLTSQANGNYRLSAQQQLDALKAEAEQQQRLAEQQSKQAASSRQGQIRSAQAWLIKHGYALTETGELDARTKAAIEAFEKAEKLLVTGEVDATLLSKLEEAYWRKDKAAFDAAKKTHTEQSYNQYLNSWLDGKYRSEAEQGQLAAREAEQQRQTAAAAAKKAAEEKAKRDASAKLAAEKRAEAVARYVGKMVYIPSGSFRMGCSEGDTECEDNEKPVRQVSINAFMLMETEATFAMWDACVADGGCSHKPDDRSWGRGNWPVMNVSYNDITQQFIPWLNKTTGQTFRLPSEAEWEYAARGGSSAKYSWGNSISCSQARYGRLAATDNFPAGGECSQSYDGTVVVKSFNANGYGLFDMHGNVWEWTQDCWNSIYSGAPTNSSARQSGDCFHRVRRGGSWNYSPGSLRVSSRGSYGTDYRGNSGGFRLAQDIK